jgi:hypothetical protein
MELQKMLRPLLLAPFVLVSGNVHAATVDGTEGATSSGTVDITLDKADLVHISGLTAIAMSLQADGSAAGQTTACIHRAGTPGYNLTATGDGASGAFTASVAGVGGAAGTDPVTYSVLFTDGANTKAPLLTGTPKGGLLADISTTDSTSCGGTPNVTLDVEISTVDYAAATAATHVGVLTLLVSPE